MLKVMNDKTNIRKRRKRRANVKEVTLSLLTLFLSIFAFVVALWIIVAVSAVIYNARF